MSLSRKTYISLFFCLLSVLAVGQQRVVRWRGTETLVNDSLRITRVAVDGGAYNATDPLPVLTESFPVGGLMHDVELTDIRYTALSDFEARLLEGQTLPETPQVNSIITRMDGKTCQQVSIEPYVCVNGTRQKVASYTLRHSEGMQRVTADHTYAGQSVLHSGRWIKLRVSESGLYQLSYSALRGLGIDPSKARVYGYGGAILAQDFTADKYDDLPEVSLYDNGSALVFWAQGPVRWDYVKDNGRFAHKQNPYSFYGYYFLSEEGEGAPARVQTAEPYEVQEPFAVNVNTFVDHLVHEVDEVNILALSSRPGGREFYENPITGGESKTINFDTPNLIDTLDSYAVTEGAAKATTLTSMYINIAGQTGNASYQDNTSVLTAAVTGRITLKYKAQQGNSTSVDVTYRCNTDDGRLYFNYIELHPHRALKKGGKPLAFNNSYHLFRKSLSTSGFNYRLAGASSQTLLLDITTPVTMTRVPATLRGDTLLFSSNAALHSYVAVNNNEIASLPAPDIVGEVTNQNLHAITDVDMLIVTNKLFLDQAYRLAEAHEQYDDMSVAVVTDEEIYNEFSSGNPDASAIRWICKMLYEKNSGTPLRYLLLMGDGTYDNRQITPNSGNNLIITYQSSNSLYEPMAYSMDDYFSFLNSSDGETDATGEMFIGVGRMPVNTTQEAAQMVDKTISYIRGDNFGDWRNKIVFLADDGDANLMHTWQADSVATQLKKDVLDFNLQKMYLEAYQQEISASGERYHIAKNKLDNLFNKGMLLFNYTGHGSTLAITNENMLVHTEARDMTSENLSFWLLATCSFSHYDRRDVCIAEYALLNPQGGAIGVFSSTRTVFASQNMFLNYNFSHHLFTKVDGRWPRIGDAVVKAKNDITEVYEKRRYDAGNRLAYSLLGDPAVMLRYPDPYIVVTQSVNGIKPSEKDTVRALQEVEIAGYIARSDSSKVTDFNGEILVQMFDKEARVNMLNNDGIKLDDNFDATFLDRNSTLFKGKTQVTDGEFTVKMLIPKDIHYNYGTGRLEYYAMDTVTRADANGHEERFIIGGSEKITDNDEQGPELDIYLNSTAFRSGDKVNETPVFLAFMSDEHGINTAGSGIGHDLMLTVDDDYKQTYNLNDYFSSGSSYTEGSVTYLMSKLEPGRHSLTFRVWDLFNNSTSKSLDFVVVKGLSPRLIDVLVYPNPVASGENMHFVITHDRPNTALQTTLTIYDVQGRKVWQQSQQSGEQIEINIPTSNLSRGVYIYRLEARTNASDTSSKIGKLIVR